MAFTAMAGIHASLTLAVEKFLHSLGITPNAYLYLFPDDMNLEKMNSMISDGVFPTVHKLAPALIHAFFFTLARYVIHYLLFKVCSSLQGLGFIALTCSNCAATSGVYVEH
jgi:hypothetical protein